MPSCSAFGCSNSSKKGFLTKKFPKDEKRRKEWIIRIKRGQWTPSHSSALCEVHFAPEMWEKTREDGSRKLKLNAVPTIFPFNTNSTKKIIQKAPVSAPLINSPIPTKDEIKGEEIKLDSPSTVQMSKIAVDIDGNTHSET